MSQSVRKAKPFDEKQMVKMSTGISQMSSLSMMLGNYVSHDCVPSIGTNKAITNDTSKPVLNRTLEYNANGTILATSHSDAQIRFWDSDTLAEKYTMPCSANVTIMAYSRRKELMAACDSYNCMNIIKMWPPRKVNDFAHSQAINGCAFARTSDQVATASNVIKIWDVGQFKQASAQFTSSRAPSTVDFPSSDAFLVSGHKDGKVRIWDRNQRRVQHEIQAHSQAITCVKNYNQGVYILTCGQDGNLGKIDIRRLDKAVCYFEHDDFICNNAHTRMSLSNNDSYAVVPSGTNKLVVFDLNCENNEGHKMLSDGYNSPFGS